MVELYITFSIEGESTYASFSMYLTYDEEWENYEECYAKEELGDDDFYPFGGGLNFVEIPSGESDPDASPCSFIGMNFAFRDEGGEFSKAYIQGPEGDWWYLYTADQIRDADYGDSSDYSSDYSGDYSYDYSGAGDYDMGDFDMNDFDMGDYDMGDLDFSELEDMDFDFSDLEGMDFGGF
jgi:hypothetical protein